MLNSNQARKVLFYSLVALIFTGLPALAQGRESVELDPQTIEVLKPILIGLSILATVLSVGTAFFTTYLVTGAKRSTTVAPNLIMAIATMVIILASSMLVGQFMPISAYLIAANSAVVTWVLLLAVANA